MSCFSPIIAWYSTQMGTTGKRLITFSRGNAAFPAPLRLPCGKCIGCRKDAARQWAIRCMHERRMTDKNVFLTLTYDDENLPKGNTLCKRDLQLFMKRLRKFLEPEKVRFYACGEYGSAGGRPHYHLLLFGWQPGSRKSIRKSKSGADLYCSDEITALWPLGLHVCGDVDHASCLYVANYVTKKFIGKPEEAIRHYEIVCGDGEIVIREPEFALMSRRPGIGASYVDKYATELKNHDNIIYNSTPVSIPRYYDNRLLSEAHIEPATMDNVKKLRRKLALKQKADNTPERRRVREIFEHKKLSHFKKGNL